MKKNDWLNNSRKLNYTYKLDYSTFQLLEELSDLTEWPKNKILDVALYDYAFKIKEIRKLPSE